MAHADYFLKIEGLDGESQDDKHKNEIHIESFHFGVANHGSGHTGTGSGSGKAVVHDIHFSKHADKSSPNLFIACCNGKHFPKATLTLRKAGENPHEYQTFQMEQVFVSSFNSKGPPTGGIASESFSLNFAKIEFVYTPQNKDGTAGAKITKAWNVATQKAS
jgi:type VI secretion system secreted protein Hcp